LLNLTGVSFSVVTGAELNESFGQMIAGNPRHAETSGDPDEFGTVGNVVVDTTPEGHTISWPYNLTVPMLLTEFLGLVCGGFDLVMSQRRS